MNVDDRIADPWGTRTPFAAGDAWPVRVDEFTVEQPERWVQSASLLHSNGDAIDIGVRDGRIVGVRGRAADRVNRGRLDPKDVYGWQANASPDRLTRPLVRDSGKLVEAGWDEAMRRIVDRSKELVDGPGGWGRFGFYTTGQLFLEEYYTLGVIGKAGLGTPHMDGNTRLCTATAASALKASFGTDGQPASYTDVDQCDAIAFWGHNVAETQAVLWMRMLDRRRGPHPPAMLAVDPRPTPVAREADVHLAVRPGTNLALMNGLLRLILHRGWADRDYIAAHTMGIEQLSYASWVVGVAHIRSVDADWPAVGTRIHHRVGPWPLQINDQTSVRTVEPDSVLELDAQMWPLGAGIVRIWLEPVSSASTRVHMAETLTSGIGRVLPDAVQALLLRPRNAEALQRLDDIAVHRESR